MKAIKGLAKFISTLSLYALSYLLLAFVGTLPFPSIPGITIESIPTLMSIVVAVGGVASLISDGVKKAILSLLIEGGAAAAAFGLSLLLGTSSYFSSVIVMFVVLIIGIPIITWKLSTGRLKITW